MKPKKIYSKLNRATKKQIIDFLIPLIERAIMINACWIDGNDGVHPRYPKFDQMDATSSIWAAVLDLHDDYGPVGSIPKKPTPLPDEDGPTQSTL